MLLRPRGIMRRRTITRMAILGGKRGRPAGPQVTAPAPLAAPPHTTDDQRANTAERRPA